MAHVACTRDWNVCHICVAVYNIMHSNRYPLFAAPKLWLISLMENMGTVCAEKTFDRLSLFADRSHDYYA